VNNRATRMTWRARLAMVFGAGLALTAAACAGGPSTLTSPSGVSPSTQNVNSSSNDRLFSVTIAETEISVGVSELTVTVSNLNVNSSQKLGSVQIDLPSGLVPTAVNTFSLNTWSGVISGQTVEVGGPGNAKLDNQGTVTFKIHLTSSVCGTYNFAAARGSSEALADAFASNWTAPSTSPSVNVIGCSIECPAAQAVANTYVDSLGGVDGRERSFIITAIGEVTIGSTFQGYDKCDTGFGPAVRAFVDQKRTEFASL
jgi:hypothetical protein